MAISVPGGISFSRYVNITSSLGGVSQVGQRSLGACIITVNNLCPTGTLLNFNSANAVGLYFGFASGEYYRAVFYFSFISKNGYQPQVLSFWFWNNDAATADYIFGAQGPYTLSTFTAITSGELTLTMGGFTHTLTGINLSSAASLAAVAADIQTAIQAYSAGGAAWTAATVTYSATGSGSFNLVSGLTGVDTIAIVAAPASDLAGPLGWLSVGTVLSNGTAAQTLTANLALLNSTNNNFGSFCLGASSIITEANIVAAANWNYALTPNVQYLFSWVVTPANASTWQAAVSGVGGHCGTIQSPVTGEYPEMLPMAVLAATNYQAQNSVQNYEFQQANLTPSVTTDAAANTYDGIDLNYYGQTQINGQYIAFYQTGVISGGQPSDPNLINIYANELWLKSSMTAAAMNLLLSLANVSANTQGRSQLLAIVQSVINQALFNGTISVGNTLTVEQQLFITNATGSNTAWQQVQNIGYWLGVEFQTYVVGGITKYKAIYTLIYAKDNVISLVDGTDILI